MANTLPAKFDNGLLRWVLPFLTSEAFEVLLRLLKIIHRQLSREWHEGMYEILEYDSVLELKDKQGKTALLKRRQKVRFLQDNIIAYEDQAWGEGDIFADYQCSPGVAVDRYRDGFKWKVLISLRETKQRGDVTVFHFTRTMTGGFATSTEWFQTEISHRARHLRLGIIFPRDRPCQEALLVERNRNRTTDLGPPCFNRLPDGRQKLSWETRRPGLNELYTIKWRW